MKNCKIILSTAVLILLATACKPTEKNYQMAYDKAYQASQRKLEAEKTGSDGRTLESMDAPGVRSIDNQKLRVGNELVKPLDDSIVIPADKTLVVAVARYNWVTNARSYAEMLKEEYPEAMVVTDGGGVYYVVTEAVTGASEAAMAIEAFKKKHPQPSYFGLDGDPVVLYVSRR